MRYPTGIDLGTTYSAIAKWENGFAHTGPVVYNCPSENLNWIASKIFLADLNDCENNVVIGSSSIKKSFTKPEHFFSAFKRGMDDNAPITREGVEFTPVKLSTMMLRHMFKQIVNPVEGMDYIPAGVVVSVPYYFTEPPCQNTGNALEYALEIYKDHPQYTVKGIDPKTVAEPVAAGLDFAFTNSLDINGRENIMIFDLGGGTFDVTVYELNNDVANRRIVFTVLSTDGDARLGGEDFDASIREFVLHDNGITPEIFNDPIYKSCVAQLSAQITEAKCRISSELDDSIVLLPFFNTPELSYVLTRTHIEQIMRGEKGCKIDYLSKIDDIVDRCILSSGISASQIDRVILVGGSSKMPCIRQLLDKKVGVKKIYSSPNPSETVARGAAIWAAYKLDDKNKGNEGYKRNLDKWDEIIIKEKTAHRLGILLANGTVDNIINQNVFTPAQGTKIYIPSKLDGEKVEMNPLVVRQGKDVVGTIPFPDIYAHGRDKQDIKINITLIAESTAVKVNIYVPQGNKDASDINTIGEIKIS